MWRKGLAATVAAIGVSSPALAQTGRIVGTVTSAADGRPVVGAQVVIIGTQVGAATRDDGRYTIVSRPGAYRVRVARIGYRPDTASVTVTADGSATLDFRLQTSAAVLEAVAVQAYSPAAQERRNVTGSVAAVDTATFNKGRVVSPEELIQSKIPGVQIVQGNEPGGGAAIRVRGQTSINGNNDPLIVVDGIPLPVGGGLSGGRNPLAFLNPQDIANITVLKDAQATAIYGSRGAPGVILVTTKSGAQQGPQVTYGVNYSNREVAKAPSVLNAEQFRAVVQQYGQQNVGLLRTNNTNWFDALAQNGGGQEHNLSIGGQRQELQYRLSLGYLNDEGVLRGDRTNRVSGNLNYSDRLYDGALEVQATMRGVRTRDNFGGGSFLGNALLSAPTDPIYNTNGTFFAPTSQLAPYNPIAQLAAIQNIGQTDRGIGNVQGRFNVKAVPGLSATVRGSFDYANTQQRTFTPTFAPGQNFQVDSLRGGLTTNLPNSTTLVFDAFSNYVRQLDAFDASLDLTAGFSYETARGNNSQFSVNGLNTNALGTAGLAAAVRRNLPGVNVQERNLASLFARANVSLKDRYLFGFSLRRDGSSRFGLNDQWGVFPAGSIGWRLSEEPFLKNRLGPVNDLKLRYSIGVTGNEPTRNYLSFPTYNYSSPLNLVQFGNQFIPMLAPSVANPDLRWEDTRTHDVGVDLGLFQNRITITADYYSRLTNNLLFEASEESGANFNNRLFQNVGSLKNAGFELGLNATILQGRGDGFLGKLRYDANFNATTNRNRLLNISSGQAEILNTQIGLGGPFVQTLRAGQPINSFRVFEAKRGANGQPVTGPNTAQTTEYYVDQNGDNQINSADLILYKDPAPRWILGHTSNLALGRFDLSLTARAYLGYYVYNGVAAQNGTYSLVGQGGVLRNLSSQVYRYNFRTPQYESSLYVEQADFLRLENITLGYTLPTFRSFRATRVFGTVQNAFTTTKYSGVDPLAGGLGGVDNNTYPLSRIFTLGLSLGF